MAQTIELLGSRGEALLSWGLMPSGLLWLLWSHTTGHGLVSPVEFYDTELSLALPLVAVVCVLFFCGGIPSGAPGLLLARWGDRT